MNFAKTNLAAPFVTITFLLYAATFAPRATAQNTIDEVDHAILQVAWSPSGNMLAVGKAAGFCDTTINLVTGETDPELLADALAQNAVYIVDAQTGVIEQTLIGNTCSANRLDWSPDGTKIASASGDSRGFRVWDAATGVLLAEDQRGGQGMSSLSWRPGSTNEMAVADIAGFTRIVSALTGEALIPLLDVSGTVVRWSSDGNHLMMGDTYRDRIRILDYPSLTTALLINVDDLWFADLSPTGNDLASITNSGLELEVWNAHTGALRLSITPDAGDYFYKLQYSPDSQYLAVATNGNLIIYNSTTGVELSRFTHPGPLLTLDWSPDGSLLAYGGVRSDGSPAQLLIAGIVPPTTDLTGTITLPSRTPGTPAYAVPLSVKLADSGGALVSEHSPITDVNGYFTLQDLPQGTYGVWLKHAQSLAVMPSVTLDAPSVSLDFGTLAMGDADDSNQINMVDFSILGAAFGTSDGQPGYDARADFTGDSSVGISDFSLLAYNFGLVGVPPPAGESGAPEMRVLETIPPELASARLRFLTNNGSVSTRVGAAFSITLAACNSTVGQGSVISLLDGAEVHLTFDPTKLQVDEALAGLTPGTTLPTVLKNVYDNSAGTIDFAAGTLNAAAQGQFTLVTIRFRALAATGSGVTLVQASSAPYRENILTLDGAAIPPTLTPLSVKIR